MTPQSENLKTKLKNLPTNPGVYIFKDVNGKPLYIGKAKNLRNRVRTYFQSGSQHTYRIAHMVSKVADLELMETSNEVESLILEANLVHEYNPKYNVNLKDDKHFPYIKVTTNEPFPRVLVVRRLEKDDGRYFGPYTSSKSMRKTLGFLTRLFKIRTCNFQIPPPEGKSLKVCLDYHINRCGGPCEGLQTQEEYAQNIESVLMVLSGKSRKLVEQLTAKMQTAAAEQDFETAKDIRDQIEAINAVMLRQDVDVGELVDRDILAVAREAGDAVGVVMQLREGVLIGRQQYQLTADSEDTDSTILESFLVQYYNHQPNLPKEICVSQDLEEVPLLERWLSSVGESSVKVITPKRGQKVRLLELAARNARLLLDELLIQKRTVSERTSKMVSALQEALSLTQSPRRLVCFDISNTGETDAVGSCVYFDNGKPLKKGYRHFKIKGVKGQDDFAMMREVIGRYFHRIQDEDQEPPDLVVVDGGKGQLSAALAELKAVGFTDQSVIGLAKRLEEVYLPEQSDPITISKSSPALLLLKRARDEAHRFAVTYNRKVRQKRTITSELESIPGLGPTRITTLLKHFGSVKAIREATPAQIAAVKGISPKLADTIKSHLK